jgi:hypothetical protein
MIRRKEISASRKPFTCFFLISVNWSLLIIDSFLSLYFHNGSVFLFYNVKPDKAAYRPHFGSAGNKLYY